MQTKRPSFPSREYEKWFNETCRNQARHVLHTFYPHLEEDGEASARIFAWEAHKKGSTRATVSWAARNGALEVLRDHRGRSRLKDGTEVYGGRDTVNGAVSLSAMIDDGDRHLLGLSYLEPGFEKVIPGRFDEMLNRLPRTNQKLVLRRLYSDDDTANDIAADMSVTNSRVYQIHKLALANLRQRLPASFQNNP